MCNALTSDERGIICPPMDGLYNQILHHLDKAFRKLEGMVPPPQKLGEGDSFVFRYTEKTIQQAIVQKLARVISALHAARLLFDHGFVQEQAAIQRMLDELHEDIIFLSFAVIRNELTPVHREYLEKFYKESDNGMVQRSKIRAYVSQIDAEIDADSDPAAAATIYRTIYSVYSGFVHGASPHIMELVVGDPPRFKLHGMSGTLTHEGHRYDLYNPFYRAIISFAVGAKALGDDDLCSRLHVYQLEVDQLSGRNQAYRPENAQQHTPDTE